MQAQQQHTPLMKTKKKQVTILELKDSLDSSLNSSLKSKSQEKVEEDDGEEVVIKNIKKKCHGSLIMGSAWVMRASLIRQSHQKSDSQ